MKGRIIQIEKRDIAGLRIEVRGRLGEIDLTDRWKEYIDILIEAGEIDRLKECYGYCSNYMEDEGIITFDYIMGMEKGFYGSIPEGFTEREIPAGRYISYTYRGLIDAVRIRKFNEDIFYRWLKEDGVTPLRNEGIEYYGERYRHGEEDSEFEMWIPIV